MNIQEMLKELTQRGYSQSLIASEIGTTQPTISRMLKGTKTNYFFGKAIEALYKEVVSGNKKAS